MAGYLVKQTRNDGGIKEYVKYHVAPIAIPKPSYALLEDKPTSADGEDEAADSEAAPDALAPSEVLCSDMAPTDDNIPEKIDEDTIPPPKDDPATTEDQRDSRSREESQSDTSDPTSNPKGFKIHIGNISIGHFINIDWKSQPNINLTWVKNPIFSILAIVIAIIITTAVWATLFRPQVPTESRFPTEDEPPAVEEIHVLDKEIVLLPNEQYELPVAVFPKEATNANLSYVSSDTSVVTVSHVGMLQTPEVHIIGGLQTADITIQAESGATKVKTITVNFSSNGYGPLGNNVDSFIPAYRIEQRVRLAGTDEWRTNIQNAKVGDKIEFRILYTNISDEVQNSVMIKNVLPKNLAYIPSTTKLTNAAYTLDINQDVLVTDGINIGHYEPGANAYVDFTAVVVNNILQDGTNNLVNWSQCSVGQVTLQDYATIQVYKGG